MIFFKGNFLKRRKTKNRPAENRFNKVPKSWALVFAANPNLLFLREMNTRGPISRKVFLSSHFAGVSVFILSQWQSSNYPPPRGSFRAGHGSAGPQAVRLIIDNWSHAKPSKTSSFTSANVRLWKSTAPRTRGLNIYALPKSKKKRKILCSHTN